MDAPLVTQQASNLLIIHFIGRLSFETKPRPQKLANFIDRLTLAGQFLGSFRNGVSRVKNNNNNN